MEPDIKLSGIKFTSLNSNDVHNASGKSFVIDWNLDAMAKVELELDGVKMNGLAEIRFKFRPGDIPEGALHKLIEYAFTNP